MLVAWLSKFLASPFFVNVLAPSMREALASFFESHAAKLQDKAAINLSKAASTAEELKEASKKLYDQRNS